MQPRTLYALLATTLLLSTSSVVAQQAYADEPAPAFQLALSPSEVRLMPGATMRVAIVVQGEPGDTITLRISPQQGLNALALSNLELDDAGAGTARLSVQLTDAPTRDTYFTRVRATAGSGETRDARLTVHVYRASEGWTYSEPTYPAERPEPIQVLPVATIQSPRPNEIMPIYPTELAEPMPVIIVDTWPDQGAPVLPSPEQRALALERRLEALLQRIESRFGGYEPQPIRTISPPVFPQVSMRMTLSEATVNVPAEGGRVALLLQGGDLGGRVALQTRYDESTGWKIKLEQDVIFVTPHQRTWVWVEIVPGDTTGIKYAIHAGEPSTAVVAKGTAWAERSRTL